MTFPSITDMLNTNFDHSKGQPRMAWFKKHDPNFVDPEIVTQYLTNKAALTETRTQLLNVLALMTENKQTVETIRPKINKIFEMIFNTDMKLLNTDQQKIVFDVLYYDIPGVLYRLSSQSDITSIEKTDQSSHAVRNILNSVLKVKKERYRQENENMVSLFSAVKVLREYPPQVKEELLSIQKTGKTLQPSLNADRVFIHDAITTHLPNILDLYTQANSSADPETQQAATIETVQQLKLVHKHLRTISERNAQTDSPSPQQSRTVTEDLPYLLEKARNAENRINSQLEAIEACKKAQAVLQGKRRQENYRSMLLQQNALYVEKVLEMFEDADKRWK